MIIWIPVFILTLFLLVKSSDYFIDGAERIGNALGIPPLVIGVTIVALGTSLPELASSIAAIYKNSSEIVISNVTGSNITNIFLVLGCMGILSRQKKAKINWKFLDIGLFIFSALFLTYAIWDLHFSKIEGMVCLAGLLIYIIYNCFQGSDESLDRPKLDWKDFVILLFSGVAIYFSAEYNIESIIQLSKIFNIGTEIITLGAVALGTSLPELFVSIAAIKKNKINIAAGNLLGSNIFNIFGVMGVSSFFGELEIPAIIKTMSIPFMLIATLLFFIIISSKNINKISGTILLLLYLVFLYGLIVQEINFLNFFGG